MFEMKLYTNILIFLGVMVSLSDSIGFPKIQESSEEESDEIESSSALYDCIIEHICKCGNVERFSSCYDKMNKDTQDWLVDELNRCEMGEPIKYGKLETWASFICSLPKKIFKPCYNEVNMKLMNLAKEYAENPELQEYSAAMQLARVCIEPNLNACLIFPSSCF